MPRPCSACATPKLTRVTVLRRDAKRQASSVILTPQSAAELLALARPKLRLSAREMDRATLVLKSRSGAHPAGTLVPSSGDISSYLETDCVLLVHIGAAAAVGAAGGSSTDPAAAEATEAMPPLPRWSAPWQHGASTCPAAATETPAHQAPPSSGCAPSPPMLPSSPPFPPSTLPTITLRPVDPSPCSLTMHGLFPRFDGPVLPLLREAIRGVASFCERPVPGADGVLAFDYSEIGSAASAFPDPNGARRSSRDRWLLAARRECRGLLVCARTGRVLARRLHKFFNVGEVEEAHPSRIHLHPTSTLHLKIDGSLVSPFLLQQDSPPAEMSDAAPTANHASHAHATAPHAAAHPAAPPFTPSPFTLRWATRRALCAEAERFAAAASVGRSAPRALDPTASPHNTAASNQKSESNPEEMSAPADPGGYTGLCLIWLHRGWTPLFEWCDGSRAAGVERHAVSSLVLLTVRNNQSGGYLPATQVDAVAAEYGVPVAAAVRVAEVWGEHGRRPGVVGMPGGEAGGIVVVSTGNWTESADAPSSAATTKLPSTAELQRLVSGWEGVEGAVLFTGDGAFPSGSAASAWGEGCAPCVYKLKSDWWLALSDASRDASTVAASGRGKGGGVLLLALLRRRPTLRAVPGYAVWLACLSQERDDLLPRCAALLQDTEGGAEEEQRLVGFGVQVGARLDALRDQLEAWAGEARRRLAAAGGRSRASSVRVSLQQEVMRAGWSHAVAMQLTAGRGGAGVEGAAGEGEEESAAEGSDESGGHASVNVNPHGPARVDAYRGEHSEAWWPAVLQQLRAAANEYRGEGLADVEATLRLKWEGWKEVPEGAPEGTAHALTPPESAAPPAATATQASPSPLPSPLPSAPPPLAPPSSLHTRRVWCDLDGVLADFDRRATFLLNGRHPSAVSPKRLWAAVASDPSFFEALQWAPGGRALWNFLTAARPAQLRILTGIPRGGLARLARAQKKAWCARELGREVQVVCCESRQKWQHAAPGDILIDDRTDLGVEWVRRGGAFVHHVSAEATIAELRGIAGGETEGWAGALASQGEKGVHGAEQKGGGAHATPQPPAVSTPPAPEPFTPAAPFTPQASFTPPAPFTATPPFSPAEPSVVYAAIFLDAPSIAALAAAHPPRHGPLPPHPHVTLAHAPSAMLLRNTLAPLVGCRCEFTVVGHAEDVRAQAVQVSLAGVVAAACQNEYPHVTISTAAGTPHAYSNELLRQQSGPPSGITAEAINSPSGIDSAMPALPADINIPGSARPLSPAAALASPHTVNADALLPAGANAMQGSSGGQPLRLFGVIGLALARSKPPTCQAVPEGGLPSYQEGSPLALSDEPHDASLPRTQPHAPPPMHPPPTAAHAAPPSPPSFPPPASPMHRDAPSFDPATSQTRPPSCLEKRGSRSGRWVVTDAAAAAAALPSLWPKPSACVDPRFSSAGTFSCWVEAREGGGGKLDENRVPVGKDGATTLAEEFLPGGGGAQAEEGALRDAAGGCECVEECEWTELRAALGRMAQRLGDCAAAAVLRLLLPTRPMEVAAGREEAGVEGLASRSRGVDAAPKRLAAFAPRLVIVMRGLPGSGKSCAAAAIATAWNAAAEQTHGGSDAPSPFAAGAAASGAARGPPLCVAGGTRICSADSYFHAGAGILSRKQLRSMTPQQVHRAVFDIKRLGAAHAWCRDAFEDSLREGAPLVIVDNTNSRAAEYDFYRRRAKQEGYAVGVLEMGCAGVSEASGFWKRGTHSVPWEVYGTMMQRWEVDASAVLLSSTAAPPE